MKILKEPNEILHRACEEVANFKEAQDIADELIEIIKRLDKPMRFGLGMAANQIGYSKRIITVREKHQKYLVMINPEIIGEKFPFLVPSKCYSLEGLYLVKSPLYLKIKYQDLTKKHHIKMFKYGNAVTLQQEIDHINGLTLADRGRRII